MKISLVWEQWLKYKKEFNTLFFDLIVTLIRDDSDIFSLDFRAI